MLKICQDLHFSDTHFISFLADSCTLKWRPPFDDGGCPIKEYNVELLDPKTKSWRRIGRCPPDIGPPLKFPVTELVENEEYKFRVNAINDEGESEWLESEKPIKAKNPFGPPGCPQQVQLADWDVDHMDLQWAKPMSNGGSPITKYEVERRCETTKQDWEIVFECNQNTYTHTDTKGIVYKHKYQYRVCCYNKAGKSPYGGPTPLVAARKRKRKYKIKKIF